LGDFIKKNNPFGLDKPIGKFTNQQDKPKDKVFSANRKELSLSDRGKGLHFYITEFGIRPNCSDYLWSQTKLVDYPEVLDNLQGKTKRLSLKKFMQIRTNTQVRSNPEGLSFYKVTQCT